MKRSAIQRKTTRECVIFRTPFVKRSMTHKACGPECAAELARRDREKADRKADRLRRERLKTKSDHLREAQAAFNAFIRERDKHLPCISCGRFHQGAYDAGHYRSVGSMPALRFNEDNCHRQCVPCNQHKSGNVVEYRIRLLSRIGPERLTILEGPHDPAHWSIDEIQAIKAHYKARLKALKADWIAHGVELRHEQAPLVMGEGQ